MVIRSVSMIRDRWYNQSASVYSVTFSLPKGISFQTSCLLLTCSLKLGMNLFDYHTSSQGAGVRPFWTKKHLSMTEGSSGLTLTPQYPSLMMRGTMPGPEQTVPYLKLLPFRRYIPLQDTCTVWSNYRTMNELDKWFRRGCFKACSNRSWWRKGWSRQHVLHCADMISVQSFGKRSNGNAINSISLWYYSYSSPSQMRSNLRYFYDCFPICFQN